MSEDKIIAIIKLEDHLDPFESNQEIIKYKTKLNNDALRLVTSIVTHKEGSLIGTINGDLVIEVPDEHIECLKEIKQRLAEEVPIKSSIGVGENSREAMLAANEAQKELGIKVYSEEMEPKEEELGKVESFVTEEQKTKAAEILNILRNNQQSLDQIKQSSPEVYEGLVATVKSLTDIIKQDKINQEKHIVKIVGKINEHLLKEKAKKDEKMIKEIQRQINKIHEKHDSEESKRAEERKRQVLDKRSEDRRKAARYSQETGSDKLFLFNLIRKFR